ncbi:MAG: hypothetical protein JW789_04415 [Candidatus Aenigmarchaeota archaeon]|nr:hypothetical protein [Candidatus Aenigmarchaeota archaeon]
MNNTAFIGLILFFIFVLATAAESADTWVRVAPGFLNTVQCQSMMGKIYIENSAAGTYSLAITGVPEEWLEYPEEVFVEGKKTVTYVVSPSDPGTYRLYFTVEGDDFDFEDNVKLWVSSKETSELGSDEGSGTGMVGGLTGMFTFNAENQTLFIYALVAMGAALAVLLGHTMLKHEDEPERAY